MGTTERITAVRGRILDLDAHESIPRTMWRTEFGDVGELLATAVPSGPGPNQAGTNDHQVDDLPITDATVWETKGPRAPSAADLRRRTAVMDHMGVDRQLVFPGFALAGLVFSSATEAELRELMPLDDRALPDMDYVATETIRAHNEWAIRNSKVDDRVRPVGVVMTHSIDQMMRDAEALIDGGVRAVWIPVGHPPAEMSPAASELDPFWALLAENDIPGVMHVGSELNFYKSKHWKRGVEAFKMSPGSDLELPLDPWTFSNVHIAPQNFLSTMLLGGVFERHPTLRFGAIEFGGHWVGPLAEMCDMWANQFRRRLSGVLSMKPSEYMRRNFRATVFDFEPIDLFLDRYAIPEVYCFATDFPHVEGGKHPIEDLAGRLDAFGDDTFEDFFVRNGELLLPA